MSRLAHQENGNPFDPDCRPLPAIAARHDSIASPQEAPATLHLGIAALAFVVVLLAAVLQTPDGQRVRWPGMQTPIPEICTLRRLAGIDCPGCGLTRSFISMGHGQWSAAWRYHPIGPLLFAGVCLQIPYRMAQFWRLRSGHKPLSWPMATPLLWLLVGLMIGQWILRSALAAL